MRIDWVRWRGGAIGVVIVLLLWQLLSATALSKGGVVPGPWRIVRQFHTDGLALYAQSARHTLVAAGYGWLWGNLAAVAVGVLALAVPPLEKLLIQIGVVSYCLPIVAIGPLFAIVFSTGTARIVLAAMAVFFTTLLATTSGVRGVDRTWLDVIESRGGGGLAKLFKVRLRAALPALVGGLQIAAPAALLGAIIGEYIGADNGLGVMMINSQQGNNPPRTWAVAVTATVVAAVAYGLVGLLGRLLLPWARELNVGEITSSAAATSGRDRGPAWRAVVAVVTAVATVAAALAIWWAFLRAFDVSAFIGKTPAQVWDYLTGDDAPRSEIWRATRTTARDAVVGLVGGAAVAVVFYLWPPVQRALIGIALAMRSVPLVAMTPVIVLVFGRGLTGVTVIAGIVTFFPALVNVGNALNRSSKDATDVLLARGGSRWDVLRIVQAPAALPALFVSLRTAAPLAITGALLAEWLATGQGLGYSMVQAMTEADYLLLWSEVVVVTVLSAVLYLLVGLLERLVLLRFTSRPGAAGASTRRAAGALTLERTAS